METNEEKQLKLDKRYIRMAGIWAENSYCTRRRVGALIVKDKMIISDGYNGTPSGFEKMCAKMTMESPNLMYCMPKPTPLPRLHAPTTAATEPPCMSPLLPALNVPNSLFRQVSNEWFTPRNTDWKMDWNY